MLTEDALVAALRGISDAQVLPYGLSLYTEGPQRWAVTTSGSVLLAVPASHVARELRRCAEPVTTLMTRWLTAPIDGPHVVPVADLCAFARVDALRTCQACHGRGTTTCEGCHGTGATACACDTCGDEHTAECEFCENGQAVCATCSGDARGRFFGRVVNLRLLRQLLAVVTPDDDRAIAVSVVPSLSVTGNHPGFMLRPHGPGIAWMALLMPLRERTSDLNLPTFGEPDPEAAIPPPSGE